MKHGNTTKAEQNIDFVYSGLSDISDKSRKRLKNLAQSLVIIQNNPGFPMPDSVSRDIMQYPTDEPGAG